MLLLCLAYLLGTRTLEREHAARHTAVLPSGDFAHHRVVIQVHFSTDKVQRPNAPSRVGRRRHVLQVHNVRRAEAHPVGKVAAVDIRLNQPIGTCFDVDIRSLKCSQKTRLAGLAEHAEGIAEQLQAQVLGKLVRRAGCVRVRLA